MPDFDIIDPTAPAAENIGVVLGFLSEARAGAVTTCERYRDRIMGGDPPLPVLRAVQHGVAPSWAVAALTERYAIA